MTFKTTAHALCTPQSIPTIVTGRLPPSHGVDWFIHSLADALDTVFDIEGVNGSYAELKWGRQAIRGALRGPPERDLTAIEPPFVQIEHDYGGHAPYPSVYDEAGESVEWDATAEMFSDFAGDPERLQRHYEDAIEWSAERFERRLDALEDRGLLDETLVIFTSDHGELLGERGGLTGHILPMTPELVRVPTTFVHPSLERGVRGDAHVHHVDLLPTIRDALGRLRSRRYDGRTLLKPTPPDRPAYVHGRVLPPDGYRGTAIDPIFESRGVWDRDGGIVFNESPLPYRAVVALYEAGWSNNTGSFNDHRSLLRTLGDIAPHYLRRHHEFGAPSIGREEAAAIIQDAIVETVNTETRQLSTETKKQLQDLGYT